MGAGVAGRVTVITGLNVFSLPAVPSEGSLDGDMVGGEMTTSRNGLGVGKGVGSAVVGLIGLGVIGLGVICAVVGCNVGF